MVKIEEFAEEWNRAIKEATRKREKLNKDHICLLLQAPEFLEDLSQLRKEHHKPRLNVYEDFYLVDYENFIGPDSAWLSSLGNKRQQVEESLKELLTKYNTPLTFYDYLEYYFLYGRKDTSIPIWIFDFPLSVSDGIFTVTTFKIYSALLDEDVKFLESFLLSSIVNAPVPNDKKLLNTIKDTLKEKPNFAFRLDKSSIEFEIIFGKKSVNEELKYFAKIIKDISAFYLPKFKPLKNLAETGKILEKANSVKKKAGLSGPNLMAELYKKEKDDSLVADIKRYNSLRKKKQRRREYQKKRLGL